MPPSSESSQTRPGQGPPRSGIRARIERLSTPALTRLASVPAVLPFVVLFALMLTGAFVGGILGACLLVLPITFLGWLLYLTWPHLRTSERAMRSAVLLLVAAIALTQIVPR